MLTLKFRTIRPYITLIFLQLAIWLLSACGTPASSAPLLSDTMALPAPVSPPVLPNIVLPGISIPFSTSIVAIPLPADFAQDVAKMAEGEETDLTADYDVATTGNPNPDPNGQQDPCSNKQGYPPNARSVVHHDATDHTITRTVYTSDGQRVGFVQSSIMQMDGEDVLVKWVQVDKTFAGRGIATQLMESTMTDFAQFYPGMAQSIKMVMADKNGRSYSCFWSRNPQAGTVNDGGEQLPYTHYNPSRTYYQQPPAPGAGEFQIPPASIWQVPVAPQPVDPNGVKT